MLKIANTTMMTLWIVLECMFSLNALIYFSAVEITSGFLIAPFFICNCIILGKQFIFANLNT